MALKTEMKTKHEGPGRRSDPALGLQRDYERDRPFTLPCSNVADLRLKLFGTVRDEHVDRGSENSPVCGDVTQRNRAPYFVDEPLPWSSIFPEKFYVQLYRLRGWEWAEGRGRKKWCIGRYTRRLIYDRLRPGLLKELERWNVKNRSGQKRVCLHQWLVPELRLELQMLIHAVWALMAASDDWAQFQRMLDRVFPKSQPTIESR